MKMILQKHTSKFVAGLFNSLGITACVALTSCGNNDKGKQTDNQVEKLKNDLISQYSSLNEEDAKVIAEWLEKNKKDISGLNGDTLQEIFNKDTDKIKVVAEKLGLNLANSDPDHDPNPDDEKKKKIQKWVTKLNDLKDIAFDKLDEGLKEKVAQKFIDNKIDIESDEVIKEKLDGFIYEVKDEKKQNEISIKVGGEGKVTITKVADSTPTDFVFGTFDVFEKFVGDLKGKEITGTEVSLSFGFEGKMVKICEHKTGFDVTGCFEKFLNCFKFLTEFKNLKVPNLTLGVSSEGISLNSVVCNDDFYKGSGFWGLVKNRAAFFGITEESEKFEIEKTGSKGSETVKINGFESSLKWSKVVQEDGKTFVEDSGWENIFKIKDKEEPKEFVGDENKVTIEWSATQGYKLGDNSEFVEIESLDTLQNLVTTLNGKTGKGNEENFTLGFNDTKVQVCGGSQIVITDNGSSFKTLLECVKTLRDTNKVISSTFKIKIAVFDSDIKLGDVKINQNFMQTKGFWDVVKEYAGFFDKLPIVVVKDDTASSKKGKIGETVIDVEMFNEEKIVEEWQEVFTAN